MANYPWDGTADKGTHYSMAPDDAAFQHLAHVYADAHAKMHASHEFKGGITNGAHWYPLWGGMQVLITLSNLYIIKGYMFYMILNRSCLDYAEYALAGRLCTVSADVSVGDKSFAILGSSPDTSSG